MNFLNFTVLGVLGGLAVLAGLLYLLQRLRVRHRPMTVVTTLFWREAVEETRARVLVQRFRHLAAYLVALAIAGLIWLAVAEPDLAARPDRDLVVLVDASAAMGVGDRMAATRRAVLDFVAEAPRSTRVIACGGEPVTLLAPDEDRRLLERRIESVEAEAAPSTIERTVRQFARAGRARPVDLIVFSDTEWAQLGPLPSDVRLDRRVALGLPTADTVSNNVAITALGVSEAISGAWNRVDVLVTLRGSQAENRAVSVRIGTGSPLRFEPYGDGGQVSAIDGGSTRIYRDVPARGQTFEVQLVDSDANTFDDRAAVVLPKRPLIRVAISPSLDPILRPVLDADPGLVVADSEADVAIHRANEAGAGTAPSLLFVDEASRDESFLVGYDDAISDRAALARAFRELGLEHVDAQSLAAETSRPIRLGVVPSEKRAVEVWSSLLSRDYDFVDSRAFPIFIARSVRYLARVQPILPFVAVGEEIPIAEVRIDADGRAFDPVGAPFVPPRVGDYRTERRVLSASLLDPRTVQPRFAVGQPAFSTPTSSGASTWNVLALIALVLVSVEWFLYRNGRMP